MSAKRLMIIASGISVLVVLFGFVFMRILIKKSAEPMPGPAPTEESIVLEEEGLEEYSVPTNAVPAPEEIDEAIKKSDERRAAVQAQREEIGKEQVKQNAKREMVKQEMAAEKSVTETKPKEKTISVPEKKEIVFPTREETERMKSNGVITY